MKTLAIIISMIFCSGVYAEDICFNIVGKTSASKNTMTVPTPPNQDKGWQWDNDKSNWWQMTEIVGSKKTTPVATPSPAKPVATTGYHTHTCPKCNTTWGHADGDPFATHTCPKCGTQQWVQDSKPVVTSPIVPTTYYTLPGVTSGGCPNGNCPNQSTTTYRRYWR